MKSKHEYRLSGPRATWDKWEETLKNKSAFERVVENFKQELMLWLWHNPRRIWDGKIEKDAYWMLMDQEAFNLTDAMLDHLWDFEVKLENEDLYDFNTPGSLTKLEYYYLVAMMDLTQGDVAKVKEILCRKVDELQGYLDEEVAPPDVKAWNHDSSDS